MQSIRRTVPLAILVPLLTGVGLTGWIAYYNAQMTVQDLSQRLSETVNRQIRYRIEGYLAVPTMISQSNAAAIQLEELDINNPQTLTRHFLSQSKNYTLGGIRFGYHADGALRSVVRLQDQPPMISIADASTGYSLARYASDEQGNPIEKISESPNFNARTRPWYTQAVEAGKPTWTTPFPDFTAKNEPRIAAVQPVYQQGNLVGVVASDFLLTQISDFLHGLKVGETGKAFIVEPSGNLVAASSKETILEVPDNATAGPSQRIAAIASTDPLIRAAAQAIQATPGGFQDVNAEAPLKFSFQGDSILVYSTPFQDGLGLNWRVVVVVPEKDFMAGVTRTAQLTLLLGIVALLTSVLLGLMVTRWLVNPILQLNLAANQIKSGQFQPETLTVLTQRSDELGQLALVFQEMAQAVDFREQDMSQQVHRLEAELDQTRKMARSVSQKGRVNVAAVIHRSQQARLQVEGKPRDLVALLRQVVYFQPLSESELQTLTQVGYQTQYTAKEYICREDEPGDTFYIILVGRVEVYIEKHQQVLGTLSAGDFFGEMSLLLGVPRTATVQTLEPTILFAVNQAGFQVLLKNNQTLADAIALKLNERKAELESRRETLKKHGIIGQEGKFMPNVFTWARQRLNQIFGV